MKNLLSKETRKILSLNLSLTTVSPKFMNEAQERNKKENWNKFVGRLNLRERQELEIELRRCRNQHGTAGISLSPKDVTHVKPPSWKECRIIYVHNFIPFIAFGFLDNFLMILCGDYLELSFGAALGISTMACAALGNTVSDGMGIFCAAYIEMVSHKMGLPMPDLTVQQENTIKARLFKSGGQFTGIIVGCFLGMIPLLWINQHEHCHKSDEKKKEKVS